MISILRIAACLGFFTVLSSALVYSIYRPWSRLPSISEIAAYHRCYYLFTGGMMLSSLLTFYGLCSSAQTAIDKLK